MWHHLCGGDSHDPRVPPLLTWPSAPSSRLLRGRGQTMASPPAPDSMPVFLIGYILAAAFPRSLVSFPLRNCWCPDPRLRTSSPLSSCLFSRPQHPSCSPERRLFADDPVVDTSVFPEPSPHTDPAVPRILTVSACVSELTCSAANPARHPCCGRQGPRSPPDGGQTPRPLRRTFGWFPTNLK